MDSLATLTLAMAHGCGTEQTGGGEPTIEVALEVPEEARIVDVPEEDGWDVDLEQDADGRITVVTWIARDAVEPAPDLTFSAVFSGQPGDEVYLRVFQGCDGFAYRWIGTPDEPATDPAVRVRLTEPDPDNPPPPEPEPAPEPDPEPEPEPEAPADPGPEETPEAAPAPVDHVDEDPPGAGDRQRGLVALAIGVAVLGGGIWLGRRLRG